VPRRTSAARGPEASTKFAIVRTPVASRPYMPGYGTLGAEESIGLLPWSWAEERLVRSHDYWLATVTPSGAPHLMPVWAILHEERLWFSSAKGSRKALNLAGEPRCTLSTRTRSNQSWYRVERGRSLTVAPWRPCWPRRTPNTEPTTASIWSTHRPAASLRKLPSGYLLWIRLTSRAHQRASSSNRGPTERRPGKAQGPVAGAGGPTWDQPPDP
jgi:hypothetical protein